jgi:hypothetical protein
MGICPGASAASGHERTPRAPDRARLSLLPSGPGEVHRMTPHEGLVAVYPTPPGATQGGGVRGGLPICILSNGGFA